MRHMFDAIAPKYDRLNRIISFRLDVRWRKRAVRDLALAAGSRVLDLASGTGDLCIDLARVGVRPISIDLSFGMLSADRSGAPRVQADILRLPVPDGSVDGVTCGFALRNLADLPTFFAELARVVRPGGRIALLDVSTPRNPVIRMGQQHLLRSRRAADRCAALRRRRPTAICPRAWPTCRRPTRWWPSSRTAGFADVVHTQLRGGLTQLLVATRSPVAASAARTDDVRHHADALDEVHRRRRPVDLNDIAQGDGYALRPRRRRHRGTRGGRTARRRRQRHERLAAIDTRLDGRGHGPDRPRRRPVPAGITGVGLSSPSSSCASRREHPPTITVVGSDRRRTPHAAPDDAIAWIGSVEPTHGADRTTASSYTIEPGVADRALPRRGGDGPRRGRASGDLVKAVIARPIIVTADQPIDVHAVLRRLRATFGSSYRYSIDGFIGASPELLVEVDGDGRAIASPRRDRTADRRRRQRRADRRRAHRQHQEPDRAPGRHRRRPRHAAPVGELSRLGARALDRHRRQRAAPRHPDGGNAVAARPVGRRARRAPCPRHRRSAAHPASSRRSN